MRDIIGMALAIPLVAVLFDNFTRRESRTTLLPAFHAGERHGDLPPCYDLGFHGLRLDRTAGHMFRGQESASR